MSSPEWIVGGGAGAVIRTVHQSSFGLNLQVARVVQPARWFYLEPGLIWHRYGRSPRYSDLCPPEGCPPPLKNAISILGPELRVAGLAISLRGSGSGPALDLRYFRVFGDTRFQSAFPLALRWSF